MMEVYVLVARRRSLAMQCLCALTLGLAFASLVVSCFYIPLLVVLAVVFVGIFYFLYLYSNQEFEYAYFDGDVRFARVLNKSRRKELKGYNMDEVLIIAPAGSRSVEGYERDSGVKRKNYTSGYKGVPYYEMVVRSAEDGLLLIQFEPDEAYLNAVCMKYAQKVNRG